MPFDPNNLLKKNQEKNKQDSKNTLIKSLNIKNNSPKRNLGKLKKEDILNVVKIKGPVTPTEIKREIKAETYLISAILSELVNARILNTTKVKKGTSIFYYLPEQAQKLEKLVEYLNEKDQRTVAILKEKKVLQDKPQELLIRVSLRKIPDYAKPLNIRISKDEVKLFWRYYLVNDEDAKKVIREILRPLVEPKKIEEEKKIVPSETQDLSFDHSNKLNKHIEKKEPIKEIPTKIIKKPTEEKTFVPIEKDEKISDHNIDEKLIGTKFYEELKQLFLNKGIIIENAKQVRKAKDLDLIILVKTSLGKSRYYAKYKNKKRNNDADISNAIVIAQSKHLPAAYITTGEITKKTRENINTLFHNVMIVERFE